LFFISRANSSRQDLLHQEFAFASFFGDKTILKIFAKKSEDFDHFYFSKRATQRIVSHIPKFGDATSHYGDAASP
jgi:hypothetical protein